MLNPLQQSYEVYPTFGGTEEIDLDLDYDAPWECPHDELSSGQEKTKYISDLSPTSPVQYSDTIDIDSTFYSPTISPTGKSSPMVNFSEPPAPASPLAPASSSKKRSVFFANTSQSSQSVSSSKLRTASQAPRRKLEKPGDTDEIRQQRASHNVIERNYRHRLNTGFDKLIEVLPLVSDGRRVSKSEVLDSAIQCITNLQQEVSTLQHEKQQLQDQLDSIIQPRSRYSDTRWN